MMNIIRADFYRIFKGKILYITFAVLMAFLVMQAIAGTGAVRIVTPEETMAMTEETQQITRATGLSAPFIMAGSSGNIIYFLVPLVVCVAGADFSSKSIKNVLSRGIFRGKYYFAKLIPVLGLAVILQLLNLLLPIGVASIRNGFGGDFTTEWLKEVLSVYGMQMLFIFALACVGVFIAMSTQKVSSTIALYIGFMFVPSIVLLVIMSAFPNMEGLMSYDLATSLNAMANLSALPEKEIFKAIVICLTYIVGSTAAGLVIFKKRSVR